MVNPCNGILCNWRKERTDDEVKVHNFLFGVLPFRGWAGGAVHGKRSGCVVGVGVSNPKGPDRNEDLLRVQENWTL